ncbi:MAG: SurA N-terminal domain-containing protein [Neisseria sp.]|uniref:SurA N-terminal domain-containing protein n=1 Tax=Neisseria sp. TaxID=192066 RepID=UPI0026DCB563|nr:SurA N-terminal domain-containing protein [Neisseria sp.]MDO4640794.1 SurA N-terminal domain-containing protein [Neisseria sp.]
MFSTVEKYSGPAKIILGLIAVTFIGFGANTVVSGGSSNYLVEIGDQKISEEQVNQFLRNMQQNGNSGATQTSVFQGLLQRAYLTEGARMMGISVSMESLKRQIANAPIFQENGKFSQAKFNDYLKQSGLTEDRLVEEERTSMALANLENLGRDGIIISDAQAKQLIGLVQSTRRVRMSVINPEAFFNKVSVDDAALKSYYESNKKNYELPLAVKFQYIALTPQDLAAKQTVTEDELKAAFQQSANEGKSRRSVQHILIPLGNTEAEQKANRELASKVAAEAKANPGKFTELAQKYSADEATAAKGGDLGFIQKSGQLPKAFEDAAFAMQKGQVSDPVAAEYGYHIIKLNDIREKPNFEQDRALLEAEIKLKKAQQAFPKAREQLETLAFENPNDLAKVAEKLGIKLHSVDQWINKAEAERETQNMGSPQMAAALFSDEALKNKHNSEPIAMSNGALAVVRVTDVRQQTTESFDAVKEQVKSAYIAENARKLALDKAKQTLADLKTGEKTDIQWSPVQKLDRANAGRIFAPEDVAALLKAKPQKDKPSYLLAENLPQPVLIEVQAIEAPENVDEQLLQARTALAQSMNADVFEALMRYLQHEIKQKQGSQKLDKSEQDAP